MSAKPAKKTRFASIALAKVRSAVIGVLLRVTSKSPVPEPAQYKYAAITF